MQKVRKEKMKDQDLNNNDPKTASEREQSCHSHTCLVVFFLDFLLDFFFGGFSGVLIFFFVFYFFGLVWCFGVGVCWFFVGCLGVLVFVLFVCWFLVFTMTPSAVHSRACVFCDDTSISHLVHISCTWTVSYLRDRAQPEKETYFILGSISAFVTIVAVHMALVQAVVRVMSLSNICVSIVPTKKALTLDPIEQMQRATGDNKSLCSLTRNRNVLSFPRPRSSCLGEGFTFSTEWTLSGRFLSLAALQLLRLLSIHFAFFVPKICFLLSLNDFRANWEKPCL